MSRINEILKLEKDLQQETQSHIQLKADSSRKLMDLNAQEASLSERYSNLHANISIENKKESTLPIDISQFIQTKTQLEEEVNQIYSETSMLEQQLVKLEAEKEVIISNIEVLKQEKKKQMSKTKETKQKQVKDKLTSNKIKNQREKLKKIKKQIDYQVSIKSNLEAFLITLNTIQQIIINYLPLSKSKVFTPSSITVEIQELIIEAKKLFDKAQTNFDPNHLVPFLVDADKSYQSIVSAFIQLCDNIPNSILEESFNNQIMTLVEKGLMLNTRQLRAVESMLLKLEKGVEIAPLASFSNEIKSYFVENLTYFRITGWVVLEPPTS